MPKRLEKIYEISKRIEWDENNVPIYDKSIKCDGLHSALKAKFYPWRDWKQKSKTGSSRKNGIRIHKQLQHFYTCLKSDECKCGIGQFKPSKYLKAIVRHLKEKGIQIDDTEVPLYDEVAQVITRVDAVGHYTHNPESLVKISLKTGYSCKYNSDNAGLCFDNMGTRKIPCTTFNVNLLQSLWEDLMMDIHNGRPDHSFVLYAYCEYDKKTEKRVAKCKQVEYADWCREIKTRNMISNTMRTAAKSILESDLEIVGQNEIIVE